MGTEEWIGEHTQPIILKIGLHRALYKAMPGSSEEKL
jgi:hypothetical protein